MIFQKINIMLCGNSGSGKSYLLNHLFRYNFSRSDVGKPVTKEVQHFTKDGSPLTILDVPGFEHDPKKVKKNINLIFKTIKKHKSVNMSNYIHCIFYCVSCESKRFEDFEADIIRKLCNDPRRGNIPVILVLTQCYDDEVRDKMIETIKNENLGVAEIIPILAGKKVVGNKINQVVIPSYGVSHLIDAVGKYLPDVFHEALNTFRNDHKYCKLYVIPVIWGATAISADCSKKSDLFGVLCSQFSMIYLINYIYGAENSLDFIADYFKWTIGFRQDPNLVVDGKISFDPQKLMDTAKSIINSYFVLKFFPSISNSLKQMEETIDKSTGILTNLYLIACSNPGFSALATSALGQNYISYIDDVYFNHDPNITVDDIRRKIEEDYQKRI